jgi:D-alanyl-D-alanine carboxypeptidase
MQLEEQHRIDIDQPVKRYLPGFPYPPGITARQLLSHSAGIPNPVPLGWIHLAEEHASFDRNAFFHQVFLSHRKPRSRPNEKFAYSNLGYVLLGQLVEEVSGVPYEHYVTEHILNPLNPEEGELEFTLSGHCTHAKGYHNRLSPSYFLLGLFLDKPKFMEKSEGRWRPFRDMYVNGASYGGLSGTPGAFMRFIQELLRPGSVLLTDESKKLMLTEHHTNDRKPTGMCLGWFTGQLHGIKYFAHAGGGGGYYCEIRMYPEKGIGSVLMFNRTGMTDERFLDRLDRYFLGFL